MDMKRNYLAPLTKVLNPTHTLLAGDDFNFGSTPPTTKAEPNPSLTTTNWAAIRHRSTRETFGINR